MKKAFFLLTKQLGVDPHFLLKNSGWLLFSKAVGILSGVGISVVFARLASKTVYGQYSLLISIFSVMAVFTLPGLSSALLRGISQGHDGIYKRSVRLSLKSGFFGVLALILTGLFFIFYKDREIIGLALIFSSIFLVLFYSLDKWRSLLQAKEKFITYAKYESIINTSNVFLIGLAIFIFRERVIPIFLTYVIITSVMNIIYQKFAVKLLDNDRDDKEWKKTGYKLTFTSFFTILYDYLDKIIISFFLPISDVAVYSIAIAIGNMSKYALNSVLMIYFPKIYRLDTKVFLETLKGKFMVLLSLSLAITAVLYFISPLVIKILFSDKYMDSIFPAQIYTLIIPFYFFTIFLHKPLIKEKKENLFTTSIVIASLLSFVAYFVLIPKIGIMGGIVGSLIYNASLAALEVGFIIFFIIKNIKTK